MTTFHRLGLVTDKWGKLRAINIRSLVTRPSSALPKDVRCTLMVAGTVQILVGELVQAHVLVLFPACHWA